MNLDTTQLLAIAAGPRLGQRPAPCTRWCS
jgi:hypothetical protein